MKLKTLTERVKLLIVQCLGNDDYSVSILSSCGGLYDSFMQHKQHLLIESTNMPQKCCEVSALHSLTAVEECN